MHLSLELKKNDYDIWALLWHKSYICSWASAECVKRHSIAKQNGFSRRSYVS